MWIVHITLALFLHWYWDHQTLWPLQTTYIQSDWSQNWHNKVSVDLLTGNVQLANLGLTRTMRIRLYTPQVCRCFIYLVGSIEIINQRNQQVNIQQFYCTMTQTSIQSLQLWCNHFNFGTTWSLQLDHQLWYNLTNFNIISPLLMQSHLTSFAISY